jgi:hypothetical protein
LEHYFGDLMIDTTISTVVRKVLSTALTILTQATKVEQSSYQTFQVLIFLFEAHGLSPEWDEKKWFLWGVPTKPWPLKIELTLFGHHAV